MAAPRVIAGLGEIAGAYDVVLSDVWGVIHNGVVAYPAACGALAWFQREHGPVVLISNAARLSGDVVPQLDSLDIPRDAWGDLVTSGDATRPFLAELTPGPVWAIGSERQAALYSGLGLGEAGPEHAAFIACTGPFDDEVDTPEDYRERFEIAVSRGLEMICANPDIVVQRGDKLIYCAGALADLYVKLGGRVRMAGKPHAPIYELSLARAEQRLGRPLDRKRVLCIGDAIATDVRGANHQGLDVLFVANGIHGADIVSNGIADAVKFENMLDQASQHATFLTSDLKP